MFYVGVDLGQRVDFTAVAVLDRDAYYGTLSVRWLERMALGTSYTDVVRRIQEIVWKLNGKCCVAVDATGLGAPVVDMLREAGMMCEVSPVVITSGERANQKGGRWYVPRRDVLGAIQMLLERQELRIAKNLRECAALVKELVSMRMNEDSREHDDLVFAVGLACWSAGRGEVGYGRGRLPGI